MVFTGVEPFIIGSAVAGVISAINSTHARKKAKKERDSRSQSRAYNRDSELEDDINLGYGPVDWKVESRARARGKGEYRWESRSRSRPSTPRARSRSGPRNGISSIHVYNESRSSFGPLNRVDTEGWSDEKFEDQGGRTYNQRSYANSRTALGPLHLKGHYREHSRSRSRSRHRSRSRSRSRRRYQLESGHLDRAKAIQNGVGIVLAGAAVLAIASHRSNRKDQHFERRREDFYEHQDSDWRGRDRERYRY